MNSEHELRQLFLSLSSVVDQKRFVELIPNRCLYQTNDEILNIIDVVNISITTRCHTRIFSLISTLSVFRLTVIFRIEKGCFKPIRTKCSCSVETRSKIARVSNHMCG